MITIYTDGACKGNPGPGGYAYKIMTLDGEIITCSYGVLDTTNNRMELSAVISALNSLINDGISIKTKCVIYTDSAYVSNPFIKGWLNKWILNDFKGIKNIDLWKQMLTMIEYFDLEFRVVKGHSGDIHNHEVDRLASDACYKQGLIESHKSKKITIKTQQNKKHCVIDKKIRL